MEVGVGCRGGEDGGGGGCQQEWSRDGGGCRLEWRGGGGGGLTSRVNVGGGGGGGAGSTEKVGMGGGGGRGGGGGCAAGDVESLEDVRPHLCKEELLKTFFNKMSSKKQTRCRYKRFRVVCVVQT
ncbi:hypothetical protein Hanom_Chr04g00349031 [Helianthus anomalus]